MTRSLKKLPLDAREATFSDLEPLEMVQSHLPKWLVDADPGVLTALNESMAQSRTYHGLIGKKFGELQSVEVYCGALLAAEAWREFGPLLDVHRDYLAVVHVHLIADDTLAFSLRHYTVRDEPKTLLWAALQNFSEAEALPGGFNPQSHIRHGGHEEQVSAVKPQQFATLCRRLDLGQKYQTYLQQFLGVGASGTLQPSAAQQTTLTHLQRLKGYDMQVDAHIGLLKKNIGPTAYQAVLAELPGATGTASVTTGMLDGKPVLLSSMSILDTVIDGVVLFTCDTPLLHPDNRLIVYIPNDPVAPFFEFSSLEAFTNTLRVRLQEPAYAHFFSRFVSLSARADFMQKVHEKRDHLSLTTAPLNMRAAHYLCQVQLKNMFADALMLAVPTGVLDEQAREARWQFYKNAGLLLVNVAALFVPVLGDLMLAVAIGDMLKEVYEGVEDWSQGDVDHAREHLLNVAKEVAIDAGIVGGATVLKSVASRLSAATKAHFEGLQPIRRDDGTVRLWDTNMEHYVNEQAALHHHKADGQGFFRVAGKQHVGVDGKHYPVEFDDALGQWRITHSRRPEAFKPALLHNGEGAWQHAHEQPLDWQGSEVLVGRLSDARASLDERALEHIRLLTHTPEDVMRRVHLDNLAVPPLLAVTLKRFEIDRRLDAFIEQMNTDDFNAHRWADWQLRQLPHMPGWPSGRGLTVVDGTGKRLAQYGNAQWATTSHINLTDTLLEQGKLLDAVLAALSSAEGKALLSRGLSEDLKPGQVLAQSLGNFVRENRQAVFDRLYALFNVSSAPEAYVIEVFFPGLPRPVAQALYESASVDQRAVLRTSKVPLPLAEAARVYLREARLNRAIEGFYLRGSRNADTEKLALQLLTHSPHWPIGMVLEVREGSLQGPVIRRIGSSQAITSRVLVKTGESYQRYKSRGSIQVLEPGTSASLTEAVVQSLTALEREAMGLGLSTQTAHINEALAVRAAQNRDEVARVLGMQPVKPGFKPPTIMADGQIGYPLCGLDAGIQSRAMQLRVRNLFPEFNQEQVQHYLESLEEAGVNPLIFLRERKRIRTALRECLQIWIDAPLTDVPVAASNIDYSENRYQAAGLIERIWRHDPQHFGLAGIANGQKLSLDGLRLLSFPALPVMADFSHVRELNLSNMNCKDTAASFLEHFKGVESLEMDNNEMSHLPSQLERMPNLRRLSAARNNLFLNAGNQSTLNALGKLEILNLNDNFLGAELDLSQLRLLRRVYLRRTWIDQWPEGLITRPLLEAADLRENRIAEIPETIYLASPKLTRNITLSNNPLSNVSKLRLARFVMQGGSSMGINSDELLSEAAAFEFWTTGITSLEQARREQLWNNLRAEPASEDLFNVISRLTTTADAQAVRHDLSRRVWEMIEAANDNRLLRQDLINIAATPRSCTDSVLMAFSNLEIQMELARVSTVEAAQLSELSSLGRSLFRLEKLGKIAQHHCELVVLQGGAAPDELEVLLAYRIGLAKDLKLPGQPQSMTFKNLAGVSQEDLNQARSAVESAEKTAEQNTFISTLEFWKQYLINGAKTEYSTLTEPYFEALSELLKKSPEMDSQRYLRRVSEVRNQMDAAVDAWSLQKTNELLETEESGSPTTAL